MKFETKWKWFKKFIYVMAVGSGCLAGLSVFQKDFVLFVASISLGVGAISSSVLIGFIDALLKEAEP